MYISLSIPFNYSLCVARRSVYLHLSMLHYVLHVYQCIYTLPYCTLCYMKISVSTAFYPSLCVTCRSHHSILQSVLNVDQFIYTILLFTMCYMKISVSTSVYATHCVTCKSAYLDLTILHYMFPVDQCIYTIILFTLCFM